MAKVNDIALLNLAPLHVLKKLGPPINLSSPFINALIGFQLSFGYEDLLDDRSQDNEGELGGVHGGAVGRPLGVNYSDDESSD